LSLRTTFCAVTALILTSTASYSQTSVIPISFEIELESLEALANQNIPERLHTINQPRQVCVPAKYSWSWGTCHRGGLKFSKCKWKTYTSPDIRCTPTGYINRTGPVTIDGEGNEITLGIPIFAKVSATDIARIIKSESAEARANVSVSASITIDENWKPNLDIQPTYKWSQKPTIKLLDIIKITVAGEADPEIKKAIDKFKDDLPTVLDDLKLQTEIGKIWKELHKPIEISDSPNAYLMVNPSHFAFSGIDIEGDKINAVVALYASPKLIVGPLNEPMNLTPELAKLQSASSNENGFHVSIPLTIAYSEIEKSISNSFPEGISAPIEDGAMKGDLALTNFKVGFVDELIEVKFDVDYDNRSRFLRAVDLFGWFDIQGSVTIRALPEINELSQTVILNEVEFDSSTDSTLADLLVDGANFGPIKRMITERVSYNYGGQIEELIVKANDRLNIPLADIAVASGEISNAGIEAVRIENEGITVVAKASGVLGVQLQ